MSILTDIDPWAPARQEFEDSLLPKLRLIGMEIGRQSATNPLAKEVIRLYTMLHRSFDPMTFIQLKKAVEKYEGEHDKP